MYAINTHYRKAALYALGANLLFGISWLFFKLIVADYHAGQIILLECGVSLPFYILLAYYKGGFKLLKTKYLFKQISRGILQTLSVYSSLYGLMLLPISTYTMISYASPFIIAILAWIFLKERCPPKSWALIFIGFLGVALVAQPEKGSNFVAVISIFLSCIFWSANVILMRTMPDDDIVTFPFYTVLSGFLVATGLTVYNGFEPMSVLDATYAGGAGLLSLIGAQFIFSSYRLAPLYYITPFQYSQLIWVIAFGYFIWAEIPTWGQVLGVSIVAIASIYLTIIGSKIVKADAAI